MREGISVGLFERLKKWTQRSPLAMLRQVYHRVFTFRNDSLATNETVFSAISMLANAVASLPIAVREDFRKIAPKEHYIAELLEFGLNPNMTTFQFIRTLEVLRDSTGAGYAVKELDRYGNLLYLWIVRTEYVTPMKDIDSQELYYRIQQDGDEVYLHASDVVCVSHISEDGVNPTNPLDVLKNTLDYDREVKEFSLDQMQNGIHANLVFKLSKSLSPEQLDEYDKMLRRFKRSGVLYLDQGKSVEELTRNSIIDPEVFSVENITIARVARAYNLPLDKFLPDKSSYNSAEQSDLNYLRDTILPLARMYEQELTNKLLSHTDRMDGWQIKQSLNGFARADMETRGKFYNQGIRSGYFCPDDIRSLEDMPPIPGGIGKTFYVSKDLAPMETMQKGGA